MDYFRKNETNMALFVLCRFMYIKSFHSMQKAQAQYKKPGFNAKS
jgi:hypothetical protein